MAVNLDKEAATLRYLANEIDGPIFNKATQLFCLSRENNAQKKNNVYFEDPFFPGSTENDQDTYLREKLRSTFWR